MADEKLTNPDPVFVEEWDRLKAKLEQFGDYDLMYGVFAAKVFPGDRLDPANFAFHADGIFERALRYYTAGEDTTGSLNVDYASLHCTQKVDPYYWFDPQHCALMTEQQFKREIRFGEEGLVLGVTIPLHAASIGGRGHAGVGIALKREHQPELDIENLWTEAHEAFVVEMSRKIISIHKLCSDFHERIYSRKMIANLLGLQEVDRAFLHLTLKGVKQELIAELLDETVTKVKRSMAERAKKALKTSTIQGAAYYADRFNITDDSRIEEIPPSQ